MHPTVPRFRFPAAAALLAGAALLLGACASVPAEPTLRERQTGTLTGLGFHQKEDDDWLLSLPDRIAFGFDQAGLEGDAARQVADIARQLLAVEIRRMRVEGHTDDRGSDAYNQALSLRRAEAVAAALVAGGFADGDVARVGRGSAFPIADNRDDAGRAENRRVELIVPADSLAAP